MRQVTMQVFRKLSDGKGRVLIEQARRFVDKSENVAWTALYGPVVSDDGNTQVRELTMVFHDDMILRTIIEDVYQRSQPVIEFSQAA